MPECKRCTPRRWSSIGSIATPRACCVMALDAEVQRQLSRQFADREVGKRYVAVVLRQYRGRRRLGRSGAAERLRSSAPPHGRPLTRPAGANAVARRSARSSIARTSKSSRSPAARISCGFIWQSLGHPILGDPLYAPTRSCGAGAAIVAACRAARRHAPRRGRVDWNAFRRAPF